MIVDEADHGCTHFSCRQVVFRLKQGPLL